MTKISACIISRNEEGMIRGCLENIKDIVTEIIVVDGYSTDGTVTVCKEYTDKIYQHRWRGSFSVEKNYALSKAKGNWVLVIDADERLSKKLHDSLAKLTEQSEYAAYAFPRRNYYDAHGEKWTRYVFYPDCQIKLFEKDEGTYHRIVHEVPKIRGKVKYMSHQFYIKHLVPNHFSISASKERISRYVKLEAQEIERTKPKIYYFIKAFFAFLFHFGINFIYNKGFLDGVGGLRASLLLAVRTFILNCHVALKEENDGTISFWSR